MLANALFDLLDGGDAGALVSEIPAALAVSPPRALERAAALYVWKRAWESEAGASRHGGDRKSSRFRAEDQSEKISFCSLAAEATGLGERSIQLDIALAETLGTPAIKALWHSPIVDNGAALRTFASLGAEARGAVLSIWTVDPKVGFSSALVKARLRQQADSEEVAFSRLLDGWTRASSKARRRFLTEIGCDEKAAETLIAAWRKRGAA